MRTRRLGIVDPDLRLREEVAEDEMIDGVAAGPLHEDFGTGLIRVGGSGSGVIRADGTVKLAVIRPCVSRGKRVRGLPPIYVPRMLAECATIFSGWPMFMDHITEEMEEALRKRGRSVNELGGRLVETWWDGSFTHPEDAKYGFQPGAVLGYALPQPGARAMLEADPEILRCSINAWPTGVRKGRAPWNGQEGMLIEGIGDEPPGSVDWVIRAGAGGRVLQEAEQFAVSILERAYAPDHDDPEDTMNPLEGKSRDEQLAYLREEHPDLVEALAEETQPPTPPPPPQNVEGALTEERLAEMLTEHRASLLDEVKVVLEEHEADEDERVAEQIEERDRARSLASRAHQLIEDAEGLSPDWRSELKAKYVVLPSGPSRALALIEASDDETPPEERLRESVEADVERALELIHSVTPNPKPHGLGGGNLAEQQENGTGESLAEAGKDNEFVEWLAEQSGLGDGDPDKAAAAIREGARG